MIKKNFFLLSANLIDLKVLFTFSVVLVNNSVEKLIYDKNFRLILHYLINSFIKL